MMSKVAYVLHDEYGAPESGQLIGELGLDFSALITQYRSERYAQAEAAQEDHCLIYNSDFVSWLLDCGVLSQPPVKPIGVTISIDTDGENRYVPKHWPLCPECGVGRGEDSPGDVEHTLNRWTWFFKCTNCGHSWDHYVTPYDSKRPMIEDDGRCTPSGCVPYSISQAGGIPMDQVLRVCQAHGWNGGEGMQEDKGLEVAKLLGLQVVPGRVQMAAGKLTLRRLLNTIAPTTNYIVAVRGHWLAVVRGENRDQSGTSMRTEVTGFWELPSASHG